MIYKNRENHEFSDNNKEISCLQLQSDRIVKHFLERIHKAAQRSELYDSAAKVAACARQAVSFETADPLVDLSVRPLIRYYAMLQWMKSLLFLYDLSFPPSTAVLQHGVSVRRSKRQPYRWPLESVYVYKDGILQSFLGLTRAGQKLPQKLVVGDLLGTLPTLAGDVSQTYDSFQHIYKVVQNDVSIESGEYISRKIASNTGQTVEEWKQRYISAVTVAAKGVTTPANVGGLPTEPDPAGLLCLPVPSFGHPWSVLHGGHSYLLDGPTLPEWVSHFVILYSLSALCRYSPVEWSDTITWNNEIDAFFTRAYLDSYPIASIRELLFAAAGLNAPDL